MRNWKDDIPAVRYMAEQERCSAATIARKFGATRNAIIGVCHRNNIKLHHRQADANKARSRASAAERTRRRRESGAPEAVLVEPIVEVFPVAAVAPMKYRDLRLLSLGGVNQCRNFLPGESKLDGLVCAAETPPGQPWCPTCRAMYYRPARSRHEPAQRINLHSQWSGAQVAWG